MWLQASAGSATVSPRRRQLSPRSLPVTGTVTPKKFSTLSGRGFSTYVYSHDGKAEPYEASERERMSASRPGSAAGGSVAVGGSPRPVFSTRALPAAPKQAGAFQRFRYSIDPFERREDSARASLHAARQGSVGGAFVAGGNARDEKRALRTRLPELRAALVAALQHDWPSFVKVLVEEGSGGVLLALFDASRLDEERRADLRAYMNRLLASHVSAIEFALNRDPTRWGAPYAPPPRAKALANAGAAAAEAGAAAAAADKAAPAAPKAGAEAEEEEPPPPPPPPLPFVVYAMRPPWVRNDPGATAQKLLARR